MKPGGSKNQTFLPRCFNFNLFQNQWKQQNGNENRNCMQPDRLTVLAEMGSKCTPCPKTRMGVLVLPSPCLPNSLLATALGSVSPGWACWPMRSFSLRLNSDPKMGTYVAVLGWLSNIKNHIKNYMLIYFLVTLDFPFLRFALFFFWGIPALCSCHNLEKSVQAVLMSLWAVWFGVLF